MAWWRVLCEIAGVLLVLFTLREVFQELFHPTRSGSLSELIAGGAAFVKRFRPSLRATVGPLALVAVILTWVVLIAVGFALVYFGVYPLVAQQGPPDTRLTGQFLRSLYFSVGSLVTFQTFDMPQRDWLRLLVVVEGLIGFGVITASISWTVLLYPALLRSRWLARRIGIFVGARERTGFAITDDPEALLELVRGLIQVRLDLRLFPILLVFYPSDRSMTLACNLPHLVGLAEDGQRENMPERVRFAAVQLDLVLDEFAGLLTENVLPESERHLSRNQVFRQFAERE